MCIFLGFIQNNTIDSDKYSRKPLIEKPKGKLNGVYYLDFINVQFRTSN